MIIDSHCHLDILDLTPWQSEKDALEFMHKDCNVHMLAIGINSTNAQRVYNFAENFNFVDAAIGLHPCDVDCNAMNLSWLKDFSFKPQTVAIGEIGLDYYHSLEYKRLQQEIFLQQLYIAKDANLPVCIHTRDAIDDTLQILKETYLPKAGVLHCYTGSIKDAVKALDLGFYISISGIVTFKSANDIAELVKFLPENKILTETDAPYLAPVPMRGKQNYPHYTKYVTKRIAELKNLEFEHLKQQITSNYANLFYKSKLNIKSTNVHR